MGETKQKSKTRVKESVCDDNGDLKSIWANQSPNKMLHTGLLNRFVGNRNLLESAK